MASRVRTYIGIDGGGTKTRAVVGDENGRILGFGLSGPSNIGSVGIDRTRKHLREAMQNAASTLGSHLEIDGVYMGMAGIVTDTDRRTIQDMVKNMDGMDIRETGVHHDIHTALAGGLPGEPGVALIAGTGSSCYGRNSKGQCWQAGGWGHLVDDAGGGYRLALDGLTAAVRAVDGRGPATELVACAFEFLGISELPEILRCLHVEGCSGKPMGKDEIANFAIAVCKCAQQGDSVASGIVERNIAELALMVRAVANNLKMESGERKLVLAGSVATDFVVSDHLKRILPDMEFVPAAFPPIVGALFEAMRLDGLDTTPSIKNNINQTLPKEINI